jgi:hypothetical protein
MKVWAEDTCACLDVKCASDVSERMSARVEALGSPKPSAEEAKKIAESAQRVTECTKKLTDAAMASMSKGQIHLETMPAGASVREDGLLVCAATPCDLRYGADDASARAPHRLEFALLGYAPTWRVVRVVDGPVTVRLLKKSGLPAF